MIASEPTLDGSAHGAAPKPPAWPAGVASITLSALSLFLFALYGEMHWRVLFDHYKDMPEDLRRPTLHVLAGLEIYRIVALFALVFAIWTFRGRPRWLAWVALSIALLTVGAAVIIQ
jgi:hypothetical protein